MTKMRSFIEEAFPVAYLNPVAKSEGNAKQHIYRMHKWWARRLGGVFRAILLSSFANAGDTVDEVWDRFLHGHDLEGKVILDPFMGGGTTVIEALRLGCRVIGADINPVAWFITKKEAESVDTHALREAFERLEAAAGEYIRSYYATSCPDGHRADVMYCFWVKAAKCPNCGERVRLFPNYELYRGEDREVSVCPDCLECVETPGYAPDTVCPRCGKVYDPRRGPAGGGGFRCPSCGRRTKYLDIIARKGSPLDAELHALEGFCESCGRFFKRADRDDIALWESARAQFEAERENLLFPRQAIPVEGRSDPRPVSHGYTHFRQMFNERQLLCLSRLLEEIAKLPDHNVREFMLLAFSDCLDSNNMFCKYETAWHKLSVFFGLHAYHPIERPTENNPWGARFGRGTFTKCFEKILRGKIERQDAPRRQGASLQQGPFPGSRLAADMKSLEGMPSGALLLCRDARDLSTIPAGTVDAVITDPPYFDNVQYSELADFFYVWLRLILKDAYPWFGPEFSGRPAEVLVNAKGGKTVESFNRGLLDVFTECRRVLKDQGILVFTFHHNQPWAWEGIAQVLVESGFYVSASHVIRSEGKSGFHSSAGNIRCDAILVCRKREALCNRESGIPKPRGLSPQDVCAKASSLVKQLENSGMRVGPPDAFTIIMAAALEHYTSARAGGLDDEGNLLLKSLILRLS